MMYHYGYGIFPWLAQNGHPLWWSPEPRAVLVPSEFHLSKSFRKVVKKGYFTVTADTQFDEVVRLCAETRDPTWISLELRATFSELHKIGHAHSIEVWKDGKLVGGLFGVCVGKMFYGESMFHIEPNASKFAFMKLAENLGRWGFPVIDCQIMNPYLKQMGARLIPRRQFQGLVGELTRRNRSIGPWTEIFS
jgi:leucyl/phenylalanyl-tRNA--protein transferase